jgi:NAD(P)-dependent dehydrogenase (short-subunit alcohol dehydrogenase family)
MPSHPVVAITGASAGIGRATALRLARDGAVIVVSARRRDRLDTLVGEIEAAGGRALALVADVTREDDMRQLVHTSVERFGRLDVMICNAGFGIEGSAEDVPSEHMRQLLDVNYLGTFYGAKAALPIFRQRGSGHLIFVSSIVGKRGVPHMGAYAATKFAQVGLAECLRSELVGSGIHVSVVLPVSTDTDFLEVMQKIGGAASRASGPRQRAEQVADAIAHGILRPAPEIYPYRNARGLVLLNAIAPGWCDRFVKRFGRQRVE